MNAPVKAPQHHRQGRQHIDQPRQELPVVPAQAAGQPRQGEDQAVIGRFPGGQVQGHPHAGPGESAAGRPPPGHGHDAHRRQQPPQGEGLQHLHPGQGHEDRPRQHQQAHRLLGGQPGQPPQGLGPLGKDHTIAVRRSGGEEDLGDEVDQILAVPPLAAPADDPRQGAEQGGDGRHEPGAPVKPGVVEGEGHRIGQDGRGPVAHPVGHPLQAEVAQAGPGQGAEPAQPRPGGGHRRHAEGGVEAEKLRPRQHPAQQEPHARLGQPHHGPAGDLHCVPPGETKQPSPRSFLRCHACSLLCLSAACRCIA